mmetsp:Transcript_6237/g.8982  ORF Transcript_6237/g.8982 Transcript_6237/m.8982 type:complete len:901 (-) Transcript_6237:204-2906(-)
MASKKENEELEKFKAQLVDDVFGKDTHGKVQMEKVVMLFWQFRDDPSVIHFMSQFVAKFAGSRDVFAGIEFYLPQLAHMIIHLEVDWNDAILERFALVIAQQSLHFALQLNWILQGAIEDYEPELPSGEPNPSYNPLYYSRCIKLLQNIERCAVYGRPRSAELQRLFDQGKITKEEFDIMELHDRKFNALQITSLISQSKGEPFGGELLYKRKIRTACFKPKPWKARFFTIEDRMLNCYNSKGGNLVRSMPLEGANIGNEEDGKYDNMFFVSNRGFHFVLRAKTSDDMEKWMAELKDESKSQSIFSKNGEASPMDLLKDLTPSQRARYNFFKHERDFVRDVCDIAERLRFKDRAERKVLAPEYMDELNIPECVYVPLCNSTDIWRRIDRPISKDVKVFNTKERCPVIMHFVSKRGENKFPNVNLDVAEFLHAQFDILGDSTAVQPMEAIAEENSESIAVILPTETSNSPGENGFDILNESVHRSIWNETSPGPDANGSLNPNQKGNRQVQAFLRSNLSGLPRNLATRIASRRRLNSQNKDFGQVKGESIPILGDAKQSQDDDDDKSVVSVERGSVLTGGEVLLGDPEVGEVDMESMTRAKDIVTGGESWAEKTRRMLQENVIESDTGAAEVTSLMAKSNDDLRQEVFVMQMIHFYKSVFAKADLPLWLKTYRILSVSKDTGLIEVLTDATSLDGLKKTEGYPEDGGLRRYFELTYGEPTSKSFLAAQRNFMQSLAGYSLVTYLLGLNDRHNGNIMIDTRGHLMHIDFGFAFGMAPGHEFSFEKAPFKMTKEYIEVLGGPDSEIFQEFKELFVAGFMEARKNSLIASGLVEIMMYKSNYPCFTGSRYGNGIPLKRFEDRLMLHVPENQLRRKIEGLVHGSMEHFGTFLYDAFQKWSNDYEI